MRIILLSGKQGSGKTTLARLIAGSYSAGHAKFARPLYEMHEAIRGVAERWGIPFDKKEGKLLQLLGTEWGRQIKGEDVWVNAARREAERLLKEYDYVVFDDCRFLNEVNAFGDAALRVRLEAPTDVRKSRAEGWREPGPGEAEHASETALDHYQNWDLRLDTTRLTPEQCVSRIMEALRV